MIIVNVVKNNKNNLFKHNVKIKYVLTVLKNS